MGLTERHENGEVESKKEKNVLNFAMNEWKKERDDLLSWILFDEFHFIIHLTP